MPRVRSLVGTTVTNTETSLSTLSFWSAKTDAASIKVKKAMKSFFAIIHLLYSRMLDAIRMPTDVPFPGKIPAPKPSRPVVSASAGLPQNARRGVKLFVWN
jgi:hypothetical protein